MINRTIVLYRSSTTRRLDTRAGSEIARFPTESNGGYSFFLFATLLPYEEVALVVLSVPNLPDFIFTANGAGLLPKMGPLAIPPPTTTTTKCGPTHVNPGRRRYLPIGMWGGLESDYLGFSGFDVDKDGNLALGGYSQGDTVVTGTWVDGNTVFGFLFTLDPDTGLRPFAESLAPEHPYLETLKYSHDGRIIYAFGSDSDNGPPNSWVSAFNAATGSRVWSTQVLGELGTTDLELLRDGNVLASGDYYIPDLNDLGWFLAKLDGTSGTLLWRRNASVSSNAQFKAISMGPDGSRYLLLHTFSTNFVLDRCTSTSVDPAIGSDLLLKIDSSGTCQWLLEWTSADDFNYIYHSVKAGPDFSVYVAFSTRQSNGTFVGRARTVPPGVARLMIAKFSGAGQLLWARSVGLKEWISFYGFDLMVQCNALYALIQAEDTTGLILGEKDYTEFAPGLFVMKLDTSTGSIADSVALNITNFEGGLLKVGKYGHIYIAGATYGSVTSGALSRDARSDDVFILELNEDMSPVVPVF